MGEYGVTRNGFVRKRLDEIKNDVYARLKEGWGYDITINPQSFLNVLVTGFSDEVAKLWEEAENTYYAMYTMSAEGGNLDNAMQFGGITRERDSRTTYMIACTAPDDTIVPYGVLIKSATNPEKMFRCTNTQVIGRENFRRIEIRPYMESGIDVFYITLNRNTWQYARQPEDNAQDIIRAFADMIEEAGMSVNEDLEKGCLIIEDIYKQTSNTLAISNNLLIDSVTSNILFESMEYGPVIIADGLIREMVTLDTGIREIKNDIAPVPGRFEADDIEARQTFVKRCATRSKNMVESITAEIYNSVDNVLSVAGYENDTEDTDKEGRPPKSVEIIVDGGDDGEIANTIYQKKTNGIRAYGNIIMDVADGFGNIHKVGFSRPDYLYVWLRIVITGKAGKAMAPNYIELTQESILEDSKNLQVGDTVYLQTFLANIYSRVVSVSMVDIRAFASASEKYIPSEEEYTPGNVIVSHRQKALFDVARIEVLLDG
ncbi:hypothetical protein D7V94_13405 [Parablautia intestinalis]|uniref:Baseplate protein J-like domain-containing protein n=1 Tax=Parablautia intestinalis TaxID=2320100 RepID=A0A3A9ATA2_9FIRM|nr:hypothetical protein [Parablautia intestinalis]RKI90426.1 hypothetical protein D7V94_13405 [Parablautia intestinalis]